MTSAVSMPAGHEIVATDFDAYENLTGAWTAYTPTWTGSGGNPSLGNGTLTGVYTQVGKLVLVRITLQAGSTTTFGSGTYTFTLPVTPKVDQTLGTMLNDSSASLRFDGQTWIISASSSGDNMRIIFSGESGFGNMTPTLPITLATSDKLIIEGLYEAA